MINHESSETSFVSSKQYYGSCEDRFSKNQNQISNQNRKIILGSETMSEKDLELILYSKTTNDTVILMGLTVMEIKFWSAWSFKDSGEWK